MRIGTLTKVGATVLAGIGALLSAATPDAAAKGGGGGGGGGGTPLDAGTIYYRIEESAGHTYYQMNPDGSGKTALAAGVWGQPSYAKHDGERWFLRVEDTGRTFSTGDAIAELVAVSESGAKVQLTALEGAGIVPDHSAARRWNEECRWVGPTTDGRISFLGYHLGATSNTQWGLFVLDVNWIDVLNGGGYAAPTATLVSALGTWRSDGNPPGYYQNILYAWSPDGNALAYTILNDNRTSWWDVWNLRVRTFQPGTTTTASDTQIRLGAEVHDWSSTGKLLCRRPYGEVFSLNPDGSGYLELAPAPRESVAGPVSNYDARWSPAANYAVYSYQDLTSSNTARKYIDVRRVSALGTGDTNLTADVSGWVRPIAWR